MLRSVRWRKVRGDLGQYRARTALVVASIAIGAFAVGTIAGTDALLRQNLNDGFAATRPAAASIYTATGFDHDLVDVVRAMPGVDEAEGRRTSSPVCFRPTARPARCCSRRCPTSPISRSTW